MEEFTALSNEIEDNINKYLELKTTDFDYFQESLLFFNIVHSDIKKYFTTQSESFIKSNLFLKIKTFYTELNTILTTALQSKSINIPSFSQKAKSLATEYLLFDRFFPVSKKANKPDSNSLSLLGHLGKELKEQNSELENIRDQIKNLKQNIESEKITLVKDFTKALPDFKDDSKNVIENLKQEFENTISDSKNKFDELNQKTENLLNVSNSTSHSKQYLETATSYAETSRKWNKLVIISSLLFIASVVYLFIINRGEQKLYALIYRIFTSLSAGGLVLYSARQANKYEKLSVKARFIGMDLATLDVFLSDLTEDKAKIKTDMAYKYYGKIQYDGFEHYKGIVPTYDQFFSAFNSLNQVDKEKIVEKILEGKSKKQ